MTREIIKFDTEEAWLDLRRQDITSTMSPALFGLSPYTTRFELYHAKASGIEIPFKTNDRVEKGNRMEHYAAMEVGLKEGWTVEPMKDYVRIPGKRMGSSFDYLATKPDGSQGILEIKAVDFFRHKETWVEGEAPEHIEIQLQHQLECADKYEWGAIAAFTGIYDYQLYHRDRDHEFGAAIQSAAAKFWDDVDNNHEPDPDFSRDDAVIAMLYKDAAGDKIDKTGDDEFQELLARFDIEKLTASEYEKKAKATKAEIHRKLGNHAGAFTDMYRVTAGWTKDTEGRPAKAGEIIGGRAGYRQCLVKYLGEK